MEQEVLDRRLEKGIEKKNIADIVMDWRGTPFIDKEYQFPLHKYFDFSSYLKGGVDFVSIEEEVIGYPLMAKGEYVIANPKTLSPQLDWERISSQGWSLSEFEDTLTTNHKLDIPLAVLDYKGYFYFQPINSSKYNFNKT